MKLTHSSSDVAAVSAEVRDVVGQITKLEAELHERFLHERRAGRRIGYPTSSLSIDRGAPTTQYDEVLDDDGNVIERVPMPPRSDPTAAAAMPDEREDELERALVKAWDKLKRGRDEITAAYGVLSEADAPTRKPEAGRSREWCWSCERVGQHSPVYRDSAPANVPGPAEPRCRKCYDFALAENRNPPLGIVRCWAEGRKLTNKIAEAAYREEREQRERVSKRKRRKAS